MDDTSTVSWDDLDSVSVEELFNMEEYPPSSNDETYSSSQDTFTFDLNLPAENFSDLGKRSRFDDYEANESVPCKVKIEFAIDKPDLVGVCVHWSKNGEIVKKVVKTLPFIILAIDENTSVEHTRRMKTLGSCSILIITPMKFGVYEFPNPQNRMQYLQNLLDITTFGLDSVGLLNDGTLTKHEFTKLKEDAIRLDEFARVIRASK